MQEGVFAELMPRPCDMIPTVPFYEIEIREADGTVVRGTHIETDDPRAGEWFVESHYFEHDGRLLRVALLQDAEPPFDQRLVCIPA
jgi:hypothetical protein